MERHEVIITQNADRKNHTMTSNTGVDEVALELLGSIVRISETVRDNIMQDSFAEAEECLRQRRFLLQDLLMRVQTNTIDFSRTPEGQQLSSTIIKLTESIMQLLRSKQSHVRELILNVQNEKKLQVYQRQVCV